MLSIGCTEVQDLVSKLKELTGEAGGSTRKKICKCNMETEFYQPFKEARVFLILSFPDFLTNSTS